MELYLKQNKFSSNTKLFFYDNQENLCYQTNNGINRAQNGINILNEDQEQIVSVFQEKTGFTPTYSIGLENGGCIQIKANHFFKNSIKLSNSLFTLEKTKRKTFLLKIAELPIMEFIMKKGKQADYTKLSIFEEKYLNVALAFVTAICCIRYEKETAKPLFAASVFF